MTTFFGGMGLSYVTDCNEIVQDIRTPFVNVVSTMTRLADGTMTGTVPLSPSHFFCFSTFRCSVV
jgi:hypothetical protein